MAGNIALQNVQTQRHMEEETERARVSPLDPDFLIVLAIAILIDGIGIALELVNWLLFPKILKTFIDGFAFIFIGAWMYMRTRKIARTREQQQEMLQSKISQKRTQFQQQLGKGMQNPPGRVIKRCALTFFGEFIPFIGMLPWWTISVVSMLKEN